MGRINLNYWAFNIGTAAAATYLLVHYPPGPVAGTWLNAVFLAFLIFLMACLKRFLPLDDIFSFEYVIIIPCLLTYGFGALWPVAVGTAGYMTLKKNSLSASIYLISSVIIASWAAAAIFTATGGSFGRLDIAGDFIPLLCFLSTALLFVFGFRAVHESLVTDGPPDIFRFLKDESSTALLVLVDGVIATVLYQNFGLFGLGIVLLLTAGIWKTLQVGFHSERKYISTVEAFLAVTESKIPHFRGHSERVARYCRMILNRMPVNREDKSLIEYAALLHDIGKLGMPENLLKINRYLTTEEVQTLETHPEIGQRLVKQINGLGKVAVLIYCHHERYDGKGYPRRISGKDIPFGARVIAAADVFDNLLNRAGLRFQQACTELKSMSGAELDPEIVEVFLRVLIAENPDLSDSCPGQITDRLEEGSKDILEQLQHYLDKSWVLGTLHLCYIVLWEHGELKNLGKGAISDSIGDYLSEYAAKGLEIGTCYKEVVLDSVSAKIFNAYFIPVSADSCLITVFDMTEALKTERDREDRELQIYRDVISAVTQGKLHLALGDEINRYASEGEQQAELRLQEPADVAAARNLIREAVSDVPLSGKRKNKLILCVSEAATNVIKHVGEGFVSVYVLPNAIRVVISDNGPGIDISQLPQVTLRKGCSTKISLGFGFTVMLDYLDRLIMSTKNGTILVLEMGFDEEKKTDLVTGQKEVLGQYA